MCDLLHDFTVKNCVNVKLVVTSGTNQSWAGGGPHDRALCTLYYLIKLHMPAAEGLTSFSTTENCHELQQEREATS